MYIFEIINTIKAGNTQPKLYCCSGIQEKVSAAGDNALILPKKSGILNSMVVIVTALKTKTDAYLSGTTFNRIRIMVIG